ncbi:MAG: hypothetical protein AAB515_02425 [Patescibacteria group bacterium]|mgnify:CR=1 FL=1
MPQLDSASPNANQPKRAPRANRVGVPPLPAAEQARRKKIMWALVAIIFAIILTVWVVTLPSRIAMGGTNQSAWTALKEKISNAFSFGRKGDEKIKAIDVNAPTAQDLQYLREQIFPAEPVANTNSSSTASNGNTNAT